MVLLDCFRYFWGNSRHVSGILVLLMRTLTRKEHNLQNNVNNILSLKTPALKIKGENGILFANGINGLFHQALDECNTSILAIAVYESSSFTSSSCFY